MASRGVNKVIIVGNLGADPDVRYMPSGGAVANIRIATSESWKDKQTGDKQERTEWHSVVGYARLGEIMGEYLRKGSQVYIEGQLRTEKWQDKDGNDRYTTKIVARDMQMLGGRGDAGGSANFNQGGQASGQGGGYQQRPQQQAPQQNYQQRPQQQPQSQPAGMDDFDDDIPF